MSSEKSPSQNAAQRPALWKRIGSDLIQETFAFDLYSARLESPRTGMADDFYYLETSDWVTILPITSGGEVVLVEQYRWGIHQITLECPGGMISKNEPDPQGTAIRELAEETGYSGGEVTPLGFCHPNPAILTNTNYYFVAKGVEKTCEPALDPGEDIAVRLVPVGDLISLITNHEITHVLSVALVLRYFAEHGFPGKS